MLVYFFFEIPTEVRSTPPETCLYILSILSIPKKDLDFKQTTEGGAVNRRGKRGRERGGIKLMGEERKVEERRNEQKKEGGVQRKGRRDNVIISNLKLFLKAGNVSTCHWPTQLPVHNPHVSSCNLGLSTRDQLIQGSVDENILGLGVKIHSIRALKHYKQLAGPVQIAQLPLL